MQTTNQNAWTGRGRLDQLVAELDRQRASKVDFVADGRTLHVLPAEGGGLRLMPATAQACEWLPTDGVLISDNALPQVGDRCRPEVPTKFARSLATAHPSIAADLLSELLEVSGGRHLIRCLDGRVRAFLSNSYRVLDNFDLAFAALDVAREAGADVIEASLSDTHMRLKFTTRDVWGAVNEQKGGVGNHTWLRATGNDQRFGGDGGNLPGGPGTVHPIVTISNSETGHGGLAVKIGILRAICVNTSIVEDVAAQIHLGGKLEVGMYSAETIEADSKAIMLKCRDGIKAAFDVERFRKIVAKANAAAEDKIEAPTTAVANVVAAAGLTDTVRDSILAYFLGGYDLNRYGLAQAVARAAQDTADGDAAVELESLAGKLINDPRLVVAA